MKKARRGRSTPTRWNRDHVNQAVVLLVFLLLCGLVRAEPEWRTAAPGLDITELAHPGSVPDARIIVIRAHPDQWQLVIGALAKENPPGGMPARMWADRLDLVLAINAGMYDQDYRSHIGYFYRHGEELTARVNRYQSVAAFDPRSPDATPFRIIDLDGGDVTMAELRREYASLVQNLRLIRRPGENRWRDRGEAWSEAALGEDADGRILFLFSSAPLTMHAFNRELLRSGIGIVVAQHLEGGPEAQIYLRIGDTTVDENGAYGNAPGSPAASAVAWPIPNVLGLRPRNRSVDEPSAQLPLSP